MKYIIFASLGIVVIGAAAAIGYQQFNKSSNSNTNSNANTANSNTAQPIKNNLIGTWIDTEPESKIKLVITEDEYAEFKDGKEQGRSKYRLADEQTVEIMILGKPVQFKATVEGDNLTIISSKGTGKYRRESASAANAYQAVETSSLINKEMRTLTGHQRDVVSVAFSPDGKTLASGSWDNTIKLWKVEDGTLIHTLTGHLADVVTSVAFSPDGKTLASGDDTSSIKLWKVEDGTEIRSLTASTGVTSVAFSPDGKMLASGSDYGHPIQLWNVENGTEIRSLTGHSGSARSVTFSPDGKTLASGSVDSTIKLWNVEDGTEIRSFTGHSSRPVTSVAFSPDGKTLASGSDDQTIKLWKVEDGEDIRTIKLWKVEYGEKPDFFDNSGRVRSVAFSPDGKTLASGSWDNKVKLWKVEDGTEIRSLTGHSRDYVYSVAFSPDGKTLASGSQDETIKLWRAE